MRNLNQKKGLCSAYAQQLSRALRKHIESDLSENSAEYCQKHKQLSSADLSERLDVTTRRELSPLHSVNALQANSVRQKMCLPERFSFLIQLKGGRWIEDEQ